MIRDVADPLKYALPTCVTMLNPESSYGEKPENFGLLRLARFSSSLKVVGTDTDRSATYDFLLVIQIN